jgi:hypothetical protein
LQQGAENLRAKLTADFRPDSVHTVTLFIPALFWPHAGPDHDAPIVPALQKLIARSDAGEFPCDDEQAWLCGQFAVQRQADWPSAPIALLGAGMTPGKDFWLSADPVHIQLNRDQLILLGPEALSIADAEAVSLCAALNRHFAADDFTFLAPQPHRWYLRTARPAGIHTTGLSRAIGQDVNRMLPEGEERLAWHRMFNEVQMLLHAHPVNEEREQRGALPINSLWFSGGGTLPPARTSFQAVIGSSALAQGLSKLTEIPFTAADRGIPAMGANDVLIELRDAAAASMRLDPAAWKQALEDLEQHWFAPLAGMLRKGHFRQLVIATVVSGRSYRWSVNRMNLWRWWRPAASLGNPVRGR